MTTRAPRGRPTITKRADGLWHCDVDFGTDPVTGERRGKHVKRATRKQVADIVADLERSRNAGLTDPDKVTLGQWFEMWLTTGASHRKTRTALGYASHYRVLHRVATRVGGVAETVNERHREVPAVDGQRERCRRVREHRRVSTADGTVVSVGGRPGRPDHPEPGSVRPDTAR